MNMMRVKLPQPNNICTRRTAIATDRDTCLQVRIVDWRSTTLGLERSQIVVNQAGLPNPNYLARYRWVGWVCLKMTQFALNPALFCLVWGANG